MSKKEDLYIMAAQAEAAEQVKKVEPMSISEDIKTLEEALTLKLPAAPWATEPCECEDCWCQMVVSLSLEGEDRFVVGSGSLSRSEASYLAACSPDRIRRLLDALDEEVTRANLAFSAQEQAEDRLSKAIEVIRDVRLSLGCDENPPVAAMRRLDEFLSQEP